jgi:hypothetical protein
MATIHIETLIDAPADQVWDAIRDYGALHTRLVPGFVIDTRLEGDSRIVTFGNGMTARERIVGLDDEARRFAYGVVSDRIDHHSASNQVFAEGDSRCRFVWIADVLPDAMADTMAPMMRQGADILKATAETAR